MGPEGDKPRARQLSVHRGAGLPRGHGHEQLDRADAETARICSICRATTWARPGKRPTASTFAPPIREVQCPALVRDFWAEHLQVYVQHLTFDRQGRPAILFLTSPAGQAAEGPGGPRTWTVAHWVGDRWAFHPVTTSSNNFDCGSLYIEDDGTWRIIGSTERGPQPWKTGGEIAMWTSSDQGATWKKVKQLTAGSQYNHSYVRRPVDAHPDFYGLWADGDGRQALAVPALLLQPRPARYASFRKR